MVGDRMRVMKEGAIVEIVGSLMRRRQATERR